MNMPGFTAEASLRVNAYRSYLAGMQGAVIQGRVKVLYEGLCP
jgi:hypothetical protein